MTQYKVMTLAAMLLLATLGARAQGSGAALGELALGRADAPVTMVEYASLTCPHCARFHAETLPQIKSAYIDTGKVRLVFRDFPFDRLALAGAVVARCGGPERYFGLLEVLFRQQQSWAKAPEPLKELLQIGRLAGLSEQQVEACLKDEALQDRISQTRLEGEQTHKVKSTPSFLIDGQLISGAQSFAEIAALLDAALAKRPAAAPGPAGGGNRSDVDLFSTANMLIATGVVLTGAAVIVFFLSRRKSGAG